MLRMLGRLIWVAVGALGVKAYEEASKDRGTHRASNPAGNGGTAAKSRRKRKA